MVMSCDDITKPELAKMKAVKLAVCVVIAFACLVDCTRVDSFGPRNDVTTAPIFLNRSPLT
uniref:Uncharacterized protein n=1 Tax=Timema poppense TaxID=170557 RepID=A0A7R9CM96_TIMPO|nr:unnamed protein product [Timema poppensis]